MNMSSEVVDPVSKSRFTCNAYMCLVYVHRASHTKYRNLYRRNFKYSLPRELFIVSMLKIFSRKKDISFILKDYCKLETFAINKSVSDKSASIFQLI